MIVAAAASVLLSCAASEHSLPLRLEVNEDRKIVHWMGTDYPADFIDDAVMWDVAFKSGEKLHYLIDRRTLHFVVNTIEADESKWKIEVGICQIDHRAF